LKGLYLTHAAHMGVGRGWGKAHLDCNIIGKKVVLSIWRGKKQISSLLAPPGKNFGKITY